MKIIAHRGASHQAPENTLAAVQLAWDQQADGVEVDVHLSRDNQIVVIHDATTQRTGGHRAKVSDLTATELRHLDVGSWKARRWSGETIPLLKEVVETLPSGKELLVEVKCGPEFIEPFRKLRLGRRMEQIRIISFALGPLQQIQEQFPKLRMLWVTGLERRHNWERRGGRLDRLIHQVQTAGIEGVDLDARGHLTADVVERLHEAGLEVYVWTVDSRAQARRFARIGVDGLTTNRCSLMRTGVS